MSYQVLYRRYRSRNFAEIVGQEHITDILKNQIISGKISHAYLFCGPRGTGKTSTAKVFARTVNCEDPVRGEACGKCAYCKSLNDNSLSDVIEFDAASNRGIDEIRSLRENIGYLPSTGKYRVYIIDEVHMMTAEAFNALLKTLEEPPAHVIFIFCTTEPNKIPPTILSRCQRFDFKRLSTEVIIARMNDIIRSLGLSAEDAALKLIAENSDGALRDALSFLDKAVSSNSNDVITEQAVREAIGLTSEELISRLAASVSDSDKQGSLESFERALHNGSDASGIIDELIKYFRDMLVFSVLGESSAESFSENRQNGIKQALLNTSSENIVSFITILSKLKRDARFVSDQTALCEAGIVMLCDKSRLDEVISLTARVERLEKQLSELVLSPAAHSVEQNKAAKTAVKDAVKKEDTKPNTEKILVFNEKALPYDITLDTPTADALPAGKIPPATDRDTLTKFQDALAFASKFILNKDRQIVLSDIVSQLKVKGYAGGELYVLATGTASHMMDVFAAKKGYERLSEIIEQKTGEKVKIVLSADEAPKAKQKDADALIADIFGDMASKIQE